jgi:hypothetical protein
MAEIKTKATKASVADYVTAIDDEERRADCRQLIKLMTGITGKPAKMWGASIVGFDSYHYKYASGHAGEMCLAGFSSRKPNLTIYIMSDSTAQKKLLAKLGKHKVSRACLYVRRLADIDMDVLRELIANSMAEVRQLHSS